MDYVSVAMAQSGSIELVTGSISGDGGEMSGGSVLLESSIRSVEARVEATAQAVLVDTPVRPTPTPTHTPTMLSLIHISEPTRPY